MRERSDGRFREDPWWLPGLPGSPEAWHRGRTATGRPFRTPALDATGARAVAERVRAATLEARRTRSLEDVVGAGAAAATRLARPGEPVGREAVALLAGELGWPRELAAETLAGMGEVWSADALRRVLGGELGDPGVLDGFRPAPPPGGRRRRASGPPLLAVVHAGNVPGVAVTAALRGLLVRSGVLNKAPEGEPGLLALFARALAEEDTLLADTVATTWWPGSAPDPGWAWLEGAAKVVVYGGDEAVRGVRKRLSGSAELLPYGPRVGVAVVLPDASGDEAARRAAASALARDACAYEQQGCVSPRLVYVVGEAGPFAAALAEALEEETARLPRPRLNPGEAAAIRSLRSRAEFSAYGAEEPAERRVLASRDGLAWTVLVSERPEARTEALPRVLRVHAADEVEAVLEALAPLEGRVQSLGTAGSARLGALVEGAFRLGVSRIAPIGRQAWPPADWRHDGRPQLLPLLRWTDWEGEGSEAARGVGGE